jgi:uncharacterized integral membrane protein
VDQVEESIVSSAGLTLKGHRIMAQKIKKVTLIKLILSVVLGVLVIIVALQNTASVETHILFASVTMPRALLLLCTLAIGFVIGIIVTISVLRRETKTP